MNNLENLIFDLIGEKNKDSLVTEISNSTNNSKIKIIKKDLEIKQDKFTLLYEKMSKYIYFSSAGILDKVGYDIDTYMTLSFEKKEKVNEKYNLLAPNKLSDMLTSAGYDYESIMKNDTLKDEIIGSDKYFKDPIALKEYLTAYGNLATSIKNGYTALMEAGKNLRGTESFLYVTGFLTSKKLEDILVIDKVLIQKITSDLKFFGIDIKDGGKIDFKFDEKINKREAKESLAKELYNNAETAAIIKGGLAVTKSALINSFESLKQMNVIKEKNKKEISTFNNKKNDDTSEDKKTISREEKLKILESQDISDLIIKNNQLNLNFINNLFEKEEEGKSSLQNTGITINLNFNTLTLGLEVLSNPKKLVDDAINEHIPIFLNLNSLNIKETKLTYNKIKNDLNLLATELVLLTLNTKT